MSEGRAPAEGGMLGAVERVVDWTTRAFAAVGAAALAGILVLMLAGVFTRYLWRAPFSFTEELSGLLLGIAAFALMPLTVARELNIRVTILSARLGGTAARLLFVAGQAVLLAFASVFAWQVWQITAFTLRLGLKSEQSRLPLAPFLVFTTAALVLIALVAVWRAIRPVAPSDSPPV